LFSGTGQRLIGLLFGQVGRSFYATELIGLAKSGSGAVQRELASLAQSGLVTVRAVGNQRHYQANPESLISRDGEAGVRSAVRGSWSPGPVTTADVVSDDARRHRAAGIGGSSRSGIS
jgi:hypothetical protein